MRAAPSSPRSSTMSVTPKSRTLGEQPRERGLRGCLADLPGDQLFFSHTHLHGGPAPVRRFLPEHIELIWNRQIDPGRVFDLTLPLDEVAEGYRAMDERRAIKTLLTVGR